jgi:hypothetical protein
MRPQIISRAAADVLSVWAPPVPLTPRGRYTSHGDAAATVRRLHDAGFRVDLRDNDGRSTAGTSPQLACAYCSR